MKAKQRQQPGPLAVRQTNRREQAVISDSGNRCDSGLYDFDFDGGATGDYSFSRMLPAGAIITAVYSDEQTALTSGGSATLQLKAGSTNLTGALAFDTGFTGVQSQALASSATAIKLSADSDLKVTVAGAALTDGKVRFFVEYKLPND